MARQGFSDLLNKVTPSEPPKPTTSEVHNSEPPAPLKPRVPKPKAPVEQVGRSYKDYEAVTARIREDQRDELYRWKSELNRKRQGRGKRLTENDLHRVALDLLIAKYRDKLQGSTEDELRRSVGL